MVVHSCHVSVNKKFNLTQICSRLRSKTLFLSLKTFWFELEFNSVSRDHWCADAARLHVAHPYHPTDLEPVKRTGASRQPAPHSCRESGENKWTHDCLCRRKINIQFSLHASRVHFAFQSSIRQSSSGEDMEMVTCIKQTKRSQNMHNRLIGDHPTLPYLSCTDM